MPPTCSVPKSIVLSIPVALEEENQKDNNEKASRFSTMA
jgi:hypothetical protein